MVLESWVIVLLKEMYLNSLTHEKNTQIATALLFCLDLKKTDVNSRFNIHFKGHRGCEGSKVWKDKLPKISLALRFISDKNWFSQLFTQKFAKIKHPIS